MSNVDIVIPLGDAPSDTNNLELRIALRSIHKFGSSVGNIWIVTANPPDWLDNVKILRYPDTFNDNKDANLITKVLAACSNEDLSDKFIFWSDDQVLNRAADLNDFTPAYNSRGLTRFSDPNKRSKWGNRMYNTLAYIEKLHYNTSINWDSHLPQPIDKNMFIRIMSKIGYYKGPGMCINTAYFGSRNEQPVTYQEDVKDTYESEYNGEEPTKMFIGYNDKGFNSGLKELLLTKFGDPCKYEKIP